MSRKKDQPGVPGEIMAEWDAKLLARTKAELDAGRKPQFAMQMAGGKAVVRAIGDRSLVLDVRGSSMTCPFARLSLADRKSLALAVTGTETPADRALVAFYLLATGHKEQAEALLGKAGKEADKVRAAFR